MEIYDITIVGAGPSGMFSAFYAGMRNAKTKLIDSLPQLGGQLATLYPEKYIYDIPGYPKIKAGELVQNLEKQLTTFNHQYCLEETVLQIEKHEDYLELITDKGNHYSKAVILALGNGSFQPRKLSIPDGERFEGNGLDYFVTDLMKYAGRKVAIAGGGDSAIDWALMLEPIASEVYLIHRRPEFRAHEHSVNKLRASSVNILTPYVIQDISGEKRLTEIALQQVKGDESVSLQVDSLIVNYGFSSTLNIKEWGLKALDKAYSLHQICGHPFQESTLAGMWSYTMAK